MNITADEQRVLTDAEERGYLVRNGQRVATLNAWRRRCAEDGRPCVVVIQGARQDTIEVNGRVAEKVGSGEGEEKASRFVSGLKHAKDLVS